MTRSTGFARKARRLTKGGSLPAPQGIKSFVALFFSKGSTGRSERATQACDEPIRPFSGNGAKARVRLASESDISQLLDKAITDLASSEPVVSPDSDWTSDARQTIRPLDNESADQAIAARARESGVPDGSGATDARSIPIRRWKRILDVAFILLTLPCWLPLIILLMAWIRVTSAGPVFYRQERIGFRRNRFMIYKFRTMDVNAETRTHEEYFAHLMRVDVPMTKLDDEGDSRLIAGGRWLRASGLDELPQVFNVLRGEMSLVGPRPCLPTEFQRYEMWQQERVNTLPGLTGYWQVNGKNKTTFREMVTMDIFYVHNMSLRLDLAIILKTIPALMRQTLDSRETSRDGSRQQAVRQSSPMTGRLNGSVREI
jgi:lipopolysaccharide/colanic/teichoic acid biosynthesis glycosyltransferase